jgi:threonine/homoserine/homoserine lactone efflux protein
MIGTLSLITGLIVVLVPGTWVLYTVSTALVPGRATSLYAALGCTAGIVMHLSEEFDVSGISASLALAAERPAWTR